MGHIEKGRIQYKQEHIYICNQSPPPPKKKERKNSTTCDHYSLPLCDHYSLPLIVLKYI